MFIAELGIRVASDSAKRAKDALDRLTVSGGRAETAVDGIGAASKRSMSGLAMITRGVVGLAGAIGTVQLASTFIAQGRASSKALAEVSTLIEGTRQEQDLLMKSSEQFVSRFGGSVAGQLQGFYNTISAGAGSVEEAAITMEQANKLAKGGVTDIGTAVDGLTSVLNAYGDGVEGAAAVSDAMFVAMKAGKTTIGELSAGIGKVAPLAVSAGVSFDELVASVAALTKGGINTAESITGVRAMLAAVTKPSQEAVELSKALGIEFNTAALQAKGFSGFLDDLVAKTGGSSDALAILFGGVEAIVPALSLAGKAGQDFDDIMVSMASKAGATETAVSKIADSLEDRLNVQLAQFTVWGNQAGIALLELLVPAMEAATATITYFGDNMDVLQAGLVGLAATQIPAVVSGLTGLVKGMSLAAGAARAMGVAMTLAGGPLGIVLGLLAGGAAYFLLFRDNAKEAETGMYDAAAGTEALNNALGFFYQSSAPSAGKAAIELANDNYKLAQSALAAAEAELAKREAVADKARPNLSENPLTAGGGTYIDEPVDEAREKVEALRETVRQARAEMDRAARAVTSSMGTISEATTVDVLAPNVPGIDVQSILDGLKDTTSEAGGAKDAIDELEQAAEAIFEKTRTPLEKYNEELRVLDQLLKQDYISQDTFNRAAKEAKEAYLDATKGVKEYSDGVKEAASAVTGLLMQQQSWEDFTRSSVQRVVATLIESQLMEMIQMMTDALGGGVDSKTGSGGGWIGKAISTLFGAAPSFDGGGSTGSGSRTGGIDGKGGFFGILHPNETVEDHTKGGGTAANVNVPITVVNQNGSQVDVRRNSTGGATVRIMDQRIEQYMNGPKGQRDMRNNFGIRPNSKG